MGIEIERKFLVTTDELPPERKRTEFRQGYICAETDRSVRIRVKGESAVLTIKGKASGASRSEFEYDIPKGEAVEMLRGLCAHPPIEKTRREIEYAGHTWEVDVFHGENDGLVLAEIELSAEDEAFEKPPWVGQEVTEDSRYLNANLAFHPYKKWKG